MIFVSLCELCFIRKEIWFQNIFEIVYEYDATTRNGQVHQLSLKIKIYMIYF